MSNANLFSDRRAARAVQHLCFGTWVAMAAVLVGSGAAEAQSDDGSDHHLTRPSITVSGEGEVQAKPDSVAIHLGVVSEAASAEQALDANSEAMQQLFDELDLEQIAAKDRQTMRFDISPQYRQEPPIMRDQTQDQGSRQPRIIGYQVTNEVRIKVREVSRLGAVLDAVVSAGSNRVHGIEFLVENRDVLTDDARRRAVQRAREKAELLAEAAGVALGNVITIREQDFSRPFPQGRQMAMMEAQSVPIAAGQQTITARVEVVFQLNPSSD